jgi:hypothetical protein
VLRTALLALAALTSCAALACATSTSLRGPTGSREERVAAAREDRALGVLERQKPESGEPACPVAADGDPTPICWTSELSPTRAFEVHVDQRYQVAAERRRGSQALRDAETKACDGISVADRAESPFAHREDIIDVEELRVPAPDGKVSLGATVQFRDIPELTAQRLQRAVDCHLARDAALGHDVPEMSYCPLVPPGARAKVTAGTNGYYIEVLSDDDRAGREIARRARALWP